MYQFPTNPIEVALGTVIVGERGDEGKFLFIFFVLDTELCEDSPKVAASLVEKNEEFAEEHSHDHGA